MFGEVRQMDNQAIDKLFHLDLEIRELIAYAYELCGESGLNYLVTETDRIVKNIKSGELTKKEV